DLLIFIGFTISADGADRHIDYVDFARFRQTVGSIGNELVMRLGLPPFETGEEVHHMLITLEHHHRVVTAPVDPSSSGVRPDVSAAAGAFTRSSIGACHGDVPCHTPERLSRVTVGRRRPAGIVVFITVLFIGLWDDSTCFELNLPLLKHQLVLLPRPILDRSESKPIGPAVLILAMDRMAGGQMLVWVPALNQRSNLMSPFLVPVTIEIISKVPVKVRVGAKSCDRITDVAQFVLAVCCGLCLVSRDIQNC